MIESVNVHPSLLSRFFSQLQYFVPCEPVILSHNSCYGQTDDSEIKSENGSFGPQSSPHEVHARPQRTNDQKRQKNFAKMFKSRRFAAFLVLYPTDPKAVWRNLPHGRFLPLTAGTRNPLCVTRQRISCPNCELTIEITGRKSEK